MFTQDAYHYQIDPDYRKGKFLFRDKSTYDGDWYLGKVRSFVFGGAILNLYCRDMETELTLHLALFTLEVGKMTRNMAMEGFRTSLEPITTEVGNTTFLVRNFQLSNAPPNIRSHRWSWITP